MNYYMPVLLIVASNTIYQICAKSVPGQLHPMVSLVVTYAVAAILSLILFFVMSPTRDFLTQTKELNWAPFVLGLVIIGLEFGFILLYRVGWNICVGSLVCNIALALVLIVVGVLLYKQHISINQVIGIALCIGGLIFINKK